MNQEIIKFRKEIHKHPEVSNDEYNTSKRIINYVKKFNPDEIIKLKQSAKHIDLVIQNIENPFKWSEDFGYFTEKYNACYFGLGSGKDQPQLYNLDFDFPDDIIESGINIFYAI